MIIGGILIVAAVLVTSMFLIIQAQGGRIEILEFRNGYLEKDVAHYRKMADEYFDKYINEMRARR